MTEATGTTAGTIETVWAHTTAEVPQRGLDATRAATAGECAALAKTLDILAVERLRARYRLTPMSGGRYRLTGTLEARVVQACVVTLDPVPAAISDAIDVEFRPAGDLPEVTSAAEEELAILEADEYEPIEHNRIDIGRIVVETVAAALPQYPRAPGAELESREAGPADGGTPSPFAALSGWKPKVE